MTEQINGYDDLVDIGGGGFSRVYRARDLKHDRTVAVKILDSRGATDAERRAFSRELKAMGGIGDHPHAVTVLESGFTQTDQPFLVMPFFEAGTFADKLRDHGQLPVADVLDLGVKIASALETVHQLGYVHRDVKPENIFVGDFGSHAIGDFGISSISDATIGAGTVGVALTPAHAAPEVWEDERPTELTDVYSLGSTLYTLLAARPPFTADSHAGLLRKVLSEDPPKFSRDDVPYGLTKLLNQMLAKTPADRPSSALEVARSLRNIQVDQGLAPTNITVRGWTADGLEAPAPQPAQVDQDGAGSATEGGEAGYEANETIVRSDEKTRTPDQQGPLTKPQKPGGTADAEEQPASDPAPLDNDATQVRAAIQRPVAPSPVEQPAEPLTPPSDEPPKSQIDEPALIPDEEPPVPQSDEPSISLTDGSSVQPTAEAPAKSRSVLPVVGVIALLVIGGALVSVLTGGVDESNPDDDPANAAVQEVDPDDIGPILIANDPTDFRIETTADELFARWEGATNPNVVYEVMTNGIAEIAETTDTEINLEEAGLLIDGTASCVSVRVTTLDPARVGEWVGPECTTP